MNGIYVATPEEQYENGLAEGRKQLHLSAEAIQRRIDFDTKMLAIVTHPTFRKFHEGRIDGMKGL